MSAMQMMENPVNGATCGGMWIPTEADALVVLAACLERQMQLVETRPKVDRNFAHGAVYVFRIGPGFKRWTDGFTWCPSRNPAKNIFLYREQVGEAKGKHIQKSGSNRVEKSKGKESRLCVNKVNRKLRELPQLESEMQRLAIGSLRGNNYNYRPNGLAKKTYTFRLGGDDTLQQDYMVVSYYRPEIELLSSLDTPYQLGKNGLLSNTFILALRSHTEIESLESQLTRLFERAEMLQLRLQQMPPRSTASPTAETQPATLLQNDGEQHVPQQRPTEGIVPQAAQALLPYHQPVPFYDYTPVALPAFAYPFSPTTPAYPQTTNYPMATDPSDIVTHHLSNTEPSEVLNFAKATGRPDTLRWTYGVDMDFVPFGPDFTS